MAIVMPLLLLVLFAVVEFGFMFQRYVVVTNAAVEGARVGTLPGYGTQDIINRVQAYCANGGVIGTCTATPVAVNLPAAGGGTWPATQVTVTHVYNLQYIRPMVALFGGTFANSVTLTARSTMRNQIAGGGS